ncbi:MAG: VPLPA-CTERM sorting domain-containing protein [Rhodovulum sp.]
MSRIFKAGAVALALMAPGIAGAASLGLATTGETSLGSGTFDYDALFDDISSFDIAFVAGPEDGAGAFLAFSPSDPTFGTFDLDTVFAGIVASGFTDDLIELQLDPFASYGDGALLTLSGFGFGAGENPFDAIAAAGDATYFDVTVTLQAIAPVPLPAGLPLLAGGLLGFAMIARRKRAA